MKKIIRFYFITNKFIIIMMINLKSEAVRIECKVRQKIYNIYYYIIMQFKYFNLNLLE